MTSSREPALESTLTLSAHKELRGDEFWRDIPSYSGLSAAEFQDHRFQSRNCVTSAQKLHEVLGDLVSESFYADVEAGIRHSTMSLRLSPYILSLIDWRDPYDDPLRIQFLPVHSRFEPDHPELTLDALAEQADSPVPGLTHRYDDRALFLALDTCPVYCRFCTRSYSIGLDTDEVEKINFSVDTDRWDVAFDYIASRPELEDVIISGGDMYNLKAEHIEQIGSTLLKMENIRRLRYATKGPAVMPQKLLSDDSWVDALTRVVEQGRSMHKEVVLHTHFNHPNEITEVTRAGLNRLFERGITTRNQAVLQRGVNDSAAAMRLLVRRLSYINVHPYYAFVHDMVRGVEELRTSLQTAIDLEKQVRGATAGFNTPSFVVDTMGGGGKRHVHSYELYDRQTGIAVFSSPVLRPDQLFLYFDPLHQLSQGAREDWRDGARRTDMIQAALAAVGAVG